MVCFAVVHGTACAARYCRMPFILNRFWTSTIMELSAGLKDQDTIYMMPGNLSGAARPDRVHENANRGETDLVATDAVVTQGLDGLFGSNDSHSSDFIGQFLSNNSQLETMMESNPEIRSLLSNPAQLQEMMSVMSNPVSIVNSVR